jgi:hypothetical protein
MIKLVINISGLLLFISLNLAFAETESSHPQATKAPESISENKEEKNQIAREVNNFSDLFREQSKNAFKGVLLGNLIASEDRYLYFKAKEREISRMYIYLDPFTQFTKMIKGKRLNGKKTDLMEGQRLAVRVIIKEGIVLADEVFIVEGNFDPLSRYRKRVFVQSKKGEEGKDKKEKTPEKAEKAPKKSGGH